MSRSISELEDAIIFAEWREFRAEKRRSLGRAQIFAQALGFDPGSLAVPTIGVVGSKGKGTAAIYAAATLASAGMTVGLITSPALLENRDRVRFQGQALTRLDYVRMLRRIEAARQKLPSIEVSDGYLSPTGIFLLAGTRELLDRGCDVLVLEAGMGGASDELSLFRPTVVAIAAIFGEHLDVLGPTIRDVARNKAALISASTAAAVSVPQEISVVDVELMKAAASTETPLLTLRNESGGVSLDVLPRGLNRMNGVCGIMAASQLLEVTARVPASVERLETVLRTVNYPGRLSCHAHSKGTLIVDAAVSRAALVRAIAYSRQTMGTIDRLLISLPTTKDFEGFIAELESVDADKVFVHVDREHLLYPKPRDWPWLWATERELKSGLLSGNVLTVGTVSFVSVVLGLIGIEAERLFVVDRSGRDVVVSNHSVEA